MNDMIRFIKLTIVISCLGAGLNAQPKLLDDQFQLPDGFHIYRAAKQSLTGGSYDLTFDGDGRLLVADGNAVRRLADTDNDGVYDKFVTIASGAPTRGRGPQGLLVFGDYLYVVAGDGVQLFSGYEKGYKLKFERRLGAPFNTGGDHAAHTVLRGLDGYVYLVTGDGGGVSGRKHITENSSPALQERAASVFRFDPAGEKWECVGSGGRNPPSLGMNYLGEFFSFDSDMEFHVDVPFYRPVRLNHWATGGDQGWQSVGAFPPHYIDCLPGVMNVGRGSPNWGVVYEHQQFPKRYRDAFICCDYRWKSATSGRYATSGRLVAFHLNRKGATWAATMTELARAKPGAKDGEGNSINFALVDVAVAPDGSVLVTDHNQGIWRIFFRDASLPEIPPIVPQNNVTSADKALATLLTLPQPAAEWSRREEKRLIERYQIEPSALRQFALDATNPIRMRLRAIRLMAPSFSGLSENLIAKLTQDTKPEVRGQAAWLIGIRGKESEVALLNRMLSDESDFVRRRSAEAFTRIHSNDANHYLVERLNDKSRFVRYAAMTALAHRPTSQIRKAVAERKEPQVLMRVLTAGHLRNERPPEDVVRSWVGSILKAELSYIDRVNVLRVLSLYRREIERSASARKLAVAHILADFPHSKRELRWEQIRLLGEYRVVAAFEPLVELLIEEKDYVAQFHIASALAELPSGDGGYNSRARRRLVSWLLTTQRGWFSEFAGKGLQFPQFWATVLNKLCDYHIEAFAGRLAQVDPGSQLASMVFAKVKRIANADDFLIQHYRSAESAADKRRLLELLQGVSTQKTMEFLETEYKKEKQTEIRDLLLVAMAASTTAPKSPGIFVERLLSSDDSQVQVACARGLRTAGRRLAAIGDTNQWKAGKLVGEKAVHFRLLQLMGDHSQHASTFANALQQLTGVRLQRADRRPRVIWSSNRQEDGDKASFARRFKVGGTVKNAELIITCDNEFKAFINGEQIAASVDWTKPVRVDVTKQLKTGENLIAIDGRNQGGPAGLIARLSWTSSAGVKSAVITDETWQWTSSPRDRWKTIGPKDGIWCTVVDVTGPTRNAIDAFVQFTGEEVRDESLAIQESWHKWYLTTYKEAFVAPPQRQRSDESIHQLILESSLTSGNVARGREAYLKAGCYACHGGIDNRKTTIFGPALGGATLRLKRLELADAIVFPSKQVVERFKGRVLTTIKGKRLSGFITEKTDDFVSITDLQNKVTRIPTDEVDEIRVLETSLMPKRLLAGFSDEEIADLLAFLASLK